jgi:sugar phosphate isomerase/epimerase
MHIAIQEDMLPGRSMLDKLEAAAALGIEGVEFWGRDLPQKAQAIVEAIEKTGVKAAAVNHGRQGRMLDAHPLERDKALAELRSSITCAADIGARGVVFVPHFFGPSLPDLSPWKSAEELEAELLYQHLRTLSDFGDAMDVELYLEPVNHYESHLLNRLEQAAMVTRKLNHPRVKIAADLYHMALEEASIVGALNAHGDQIGHVHLADSNRRLPGQGMADFTAAAAALRAAGYEGWATLACGDPGSNTSRAAEYVQALPDSLAMLRQAGFA